MKAIIIRDEIYEKFPAFKRGVVIGENIDNEKESLKIENLLFKEIENKREVINHKNIEEWDKAHRKFGSNPNKYPPSVKSLIKRVSKRKNIPFINNLVALFNYISLKYIIPCGGDDPDKIEGNLVLGISNGNESFIPLGKNKEETPEKGEVIYFDDKTKRVMCRRWNWRNGDFSKIGKNIKKAIINIDGIGSIERDLIFRAGDELKTILENETGAKTRFEILDKDNRKIII